MSTAVVSALRIPTHALFDVFDDHTLGQRELQITLKPGAAPLGFTVSDVANQVRGALFGLDAHVFSDQQEDIDIRVRADEATRRSLYAVENLWIVGPDGRRVPLVEIAELQDGLSYATIRRVQRQRAITVTRVGGDDGAASVQYATSNGSAAESAFTGR